MLKNSDSILFEYYSFILPSSTGKYNIHHPDKGQKVKLRDFTKGICEFLSPLIVDVHSSATKRRTTISDLDEWSARGHVPCILLYLANTAIVLDWR